MTKNFRELISEYKIVIPIIQRDYAQGRITEKDKAINFLNAILKGTKSQLHLDFIYGREIEENGKKIFIPLDGQQRLTTLLLIYWYVSLENEYLEYIKNFTYEVRSSSKDFIKKLLSKEVWESLNKSNIKESIENSSWFFLSWKQDPTVTSILNMLDLIEQKFKNVKLEELDSITFEFLNLNDFNLEDELYVKMNARGKPLTEFENFKSHFEKYISFDDKKKEIETKAKLDNKWLNLFWNIAKENKDIKTAPKLADEMFYNFFYNMTLNFYIEKGQAKIKENIMYSFNEKKLNKEELEKTIKDRLYIIKNNEVYAFNRMDDFVKKVSIFDFYEDVYLNKIYVDNLIKTLDKLADNIYIPENFKAFIDIEEKDITYYVRAKFYVLYLSYINDLTEDEFKKFKRVCFNLINNQLVDNVGDFIKVLNSLKKLSEGSKSIYEYIQENNIDYFLEKQKKEEILKAKLILEDKNWEKEIIKAEKHWYLNGQIGFLLEYSKENDYYNLDKFKEYRDKFIKLWDFAKDNKKHQSLIHRALLTYDIENSNKGYLQYTLRNNKATFCSFGKDLREKNENWRRVFGKECFKNLLDEIQTNNIETFLRGKIDNFKFDCNDWRSFAIAPKKETSPIEYARNYQIVFYEKSIYINRGGTKVTNWGWRNGTNIIFLYYAIDRLGSIKNKDDRVKKWRLETKNSFIEDILIYSDEYTYTQFPGLSFEKNNEKVVEVYQNEKGKIDILVFKTINKNNYKKYPYNESWVYYENFCEICEWEKIEKEVKELFKNYI